MQFLAQLAVPACSDQRPAVRTGSSFPPVSCRRVLRISSSCRAGASSRLCSWPYLNMASAFRRALLQLTLGDGRSGPGILQLRLQTINFASVVVPALSGSGSIRPAVCGHCRRPVVFPSRVLSSSRRAWRSSSSLFWRRVRDWNSSACRAGRRTCGSSVSVSGSAVSGCSWAEGAGAGRQPAAAISVAFPD